MNIYKDHLREANEERFKRVASYTKDGEFVKLYDNICQTAEDGYDYRHVSKCCNGKRKTHKGMKFRFVLI